MNEPETPRIYVASLTDYNDGNLHGAWIDANHEPSVIWDQIQRMLDKSPVANSEWGRTWGIKAEEIAIHDHEGFGGIRIREWESIERISQIAQGIVAHGDAYIAWQLDTDQYQLDEFEEASVQEWDGAAEYAREWFDQVADTSVLPDGLIHCIDWEAYAEYLLQGQCSTTYKNHLYIYNG